MRPWRVLLMLWLAGSVASADEDPTPTVTVRQLDGARVVEAVLPGSALGTAVLPSGGIAVLVAPPPKTDTSAPQ